MQFSHIYRGCIKASVLRAAGYRMSFGSKQTSTSYNVFIIYVRARISVRTCVDKTCRRSWFTILFQEPFVAFILSFPSFIQQAVEQTVQATGSTRLGHGFDLCCFRWVLERSPLIRQFLECRRCIRLRTGRVDFLERFQIQGLCFLSTMYRAVFTVIVVCLRLRLGCLIAVYLALICLVSFHFYQSRNRNC